MRVRWLSLSRQLGRGCRCDVLFEDVRVPEDHLLGEFNRGREFLARMNVWSKVKTAAKSLGIARAAFE